MSAYIVEDRHLLYLASFLYSRGHSVYVKSTNQWLNCKKVRDVQTVINTLHRQNVVSVNHRYREDGLAIPPQFKFLTDVTFEPVQVIKAVKCLEYQSCETDDWSETDAARMCLDIIDAAIRSLPGYDDAQWGIPTEKAVRS